MSPAQDLVSLSNMFYMMFRHFPQLKNKIKNSVSIDFFFFNHDHTFSRWKGQWYRGRLPIVCHIGSSSSSSMLLSCQAEKCRDRLFFFSLLSPLHPLQWGFTCITTLNPSSRSWSTRAILKQPLDTWGRCDFVVFVHPFTLLFVHRLLLMHSTKSMVPLTHFLLLSLRMKSTII